jgi:hypothetical protein
LQVSVCNLLRSQSFALPSGENAACALGLTPLTPEQLGVAELGLDETPLWFYMLTAGDFTMADLISLALSGGKSH